ncbi:Branched-chain amino acid aminotransferase protein [Halorhabdus tiamatea SARL4B]|uniref:Aminodeoxychorismate lyase n=1 Tax=Halorhabdus tiamatea SARL4B TaxID=1033806 RepID=S6CUE6_9EURY|nr:aminotransferase class IV [Halorhabdus tiamatea]ERJ06466.1 Branched-chain amino acid aminotransferase protein [Halorhabdus tiamatea SARL4B]CCQ34369.1 aminodeoxychorismate lyase [Halorhabdus tiamatea SARL4B]
MSDSPDERRYHVDGELVPAEEATVNVRDRGFMYGDGAFETLRAYGGEVLAWDAHADRLERTCERLGFARAIPPRDDLRDRIAETLAANDLADAYVKLSISRGVQAGKLTPDPAVDPTIVVMVDSLPRGGIDGDPVWDSPATVRTAETRKIPDDALPAAVKTHNYLNGILARLELQQGIDGDPADEALLFDTDEYLAEGATSNVFFVAGGVLYTPTADQSILPGVTRSMVLDLAREEGLPVETGRYEREELLGADEAFLTNTTWELRPIEAVDGESIGAGPVTRLLARLYDRRVERSCYE